MQNHAMETCLQPFFDFLKVSSHARTHAHTHTHTHAHAHTQSQCVESKRHQSMVLKFSNLLVLYAQHNKTTAAPLIYTHLSLLQ